MSARRRRSARAPIASVLLAVAGGMLVPAGPAPAAEPSLPACFAGEPVSIVVRIGDTPPRRAWLRGGISPPLTVVDAGTSQVLWSAAESPPAHQLFSNLRLQFLGSLLPLDLDGDGVHDRIYAGDLGGRLWRFDLHHAQPAERWASGGVFADFAAGSRGFVAAPDVSLAGDGSQTWFNIALGTARLGSATVDNRFYVVRDRAPFESWSPSQYQDWRPLREDDLVMLPRLGASLSGPAPHGYFIGLGSADVLSPTLTVSGRATLALAQSGSALEGRCAVSVVVSSLTLDTGLEQGVPASGGSAPTRVTLSMTAGGAFALHREGSRALCTLDATRIPACDVDLSPRRIWWRREDAD